MGTPARPASGSALHQLFDGPDSHDGHRLRDPPAKVHPPTNLLQQAVIYESSPSKTTVQGSQRINSAGRQ